MALVYFSHAGAEEEARGIMLKFQERGIPRFPPSAAGPRPETGLRFLQRQIRDRGER